MALTVGELEVALRVRDELSAALTKAQGQLKGFETTGVKSTNALADGMKTLGGIVGGAVTVGAFVKLTKSVLDAADSLTKMHDKTGVSVQALQEFKFMGGQVGVELDAVTGAVGKMQNALATGDASAVGAVKFLGLSIDELRRKRPEEQFAMVAEKIRGIQDPAARVKVAMDIMGRGALEVMPLLIADMGAMKAKAAELGIVMSDETVAALDDAGDKMAALQGVGSAVFAKVLVPFIPALMAMANGLMGATGWIDKAKVAFEQFLSFVAGGLAKIMEWNIKLLEFVNVGGMFDRQIASMKEKAAGFRMVADDLSRTQDKVTVATVATSAAVVPLAVDYDKAAAKAKALKEEQEKIAAALAAVKEKVAGIEFGKMVTESDIGNITDMNAQIPKATFLASTLGVSVGGVTTSFLELGMKGPQALNNVNTGIVATSAAAVTFSETMSEAIGTLPDLLIKSFTGGGGVSGALKAFGAKLGGDLFKEGGPFHSAVSSATSSLTGMFGKTIGGALGAAIPGIGALIGPALSALWGGIKKLFGPSEEELAARNRYGEWAAGIAKNFDVIATEQQKAETSGRDWAKVNLLVQDAYVKTGKDGSLAIHDIQMAIDASGKSAGEVDVALKRINDTLAEAAQQKQAQIDLSSETAKAAEEEESRIKTAQRARVEALTSQLSALESQRKSLSDQIANEAPEEVMGVIESATRGQMAVLDKQIDEQRRALDAQGKSMADALETSLSGIDVPPVHVQVAWDIPPLPSGGFPYGTEPPEAHGGGVATGRGIQRLHTGGLAPDEMPAILQRGEAVLTPQATAYLGTSTIAALNAGRRGGGAAAMSDDRIVRELKRLNTRLDEGSALSGVIRGKALRDATLLGI